MSSGGSDETQISPTQIQHMHMTQGTDSDIQNKLHGPKNKINKTNNIESKYV
jgi:hypothetical protein